MAFITRGDAAFNDRFANVRSEAEAQEIFAAVMLSMPAFAASGAKAMWLGDTGAGMHCITSTELRRRRSKVVRGPSRSSKPTF
eukprot:5969643-Pleurochrysis_carterae.AAC.1